MAESNIILGGDDAYFRGILYTGLKDSGFDVILVSKTQDVVKTASSEPKALKLILMDIHQSGMDPLGVLKSLRSDHPEIQVPLVGVKAPSDDPTLLENLKRAGLKSF